jgi:short-subunit dehydrogenase
MKIEGSRIVLTGTSSGIGMELAKLLLERGAKVLGASLPGEESPLKHENFRELYIDLSSCEGVDKLFDEALKQFGEIDAFIANAGIPYYEKLQKADWEHLSAIVDINIKSVMYSAVKMKQLYPGKPFNFMATSSIMSYWPLPGYSLYSATKAAVHAFIEGLRLEWEKDQYLQIVFPVATQTRFFERAGQPHKSWMIQTPEHVARKMLCGLLKDSKRIYPSLLFEVCYRLAPWALSFYRSREKKILQSYHEKQKQEG